MYVMCRSKIQKVLFSLISFCFRWFRFISFSFRWFRFVSFRFCWFRFVSFSLISFRFVFVDFVSFRFVSFLFRFALYRCPIVIIHCLWISCTTWLCGYLNVLFKHPLTVRFNGVLWMNDSEYLGVEPCSDR
jgi:hypothetical protein